MTMLLAASNSLIVQLALLGWIPVAAGLFMFFKPVRALMLAYLLGWLLLPVDSLDIKGFWNVDKILATNFGVMLGSALFCPQRLRHIRFRAPEIILLIYAGGSIATSLTNGLGLYDGVSSSIYKLFYTAVPFTFGRTFIRSREDLLEAARLVVCGAALYGLLAIWEWRMSPQIHRTLYGYFQHSFAQHMRWDFFRPVVCFRHALGLGTFFAWTSLLGVCLYRAGIIRPMWGLVPPVVIMILPIAGVVVSMSFGPWALFALGYGMLLLRRRQRWRWMLWGPVVIAFFWIGGRYSGVLDGAWARQAVAAVSASRAESLDTRLNAETQTIDKAKRRAAFGWGGFGRNRVKDERGNEIVTDGLWVILVGMYGVVGLVSFYAWWCWPIFMTRKAPPTLGDDPVLMPLLVAIGMQAVNLLFNGFVSPILTVLAGAVVTALYELRRRRRAYLASGHGYATAGAS